MKTIINKIYAFIAMCVLCIPLSFTSCESLDQNPEDYFTGNTFWKDAVQVDGYMKGLHAYLRSTYSSLFSMGELRSGLLGDGDDGTGTSVFGESLAAQSIIKQDLRADNAYFDIWDNLYSEIVRVNLAIQELPNCSFLTEKQKNIYLAQAYGMRAYYYYLLYTTWGGVPLVKDIAILNGKISASSLSKGRSKPSEIMAFLKEDINKSEEAYTAANSDGFSNKYIWSKYATLMLKANIYVFAAKVSTGDQVATGIQDLQTAKVALQSIINSNKFALQPNFYQAFRSDYKRENKEVIFCVPFNKVDKVYMPMVSNFLSQSNFFSAAYDLNNEKLSLTDKSSYSNNILINGILRFQYKETFWLSFDANDTRRDQTFFAVKNSNTQEATGSNFGVILKKFAGTYYTDEGVHRLDADGPVYRYAEALLLMAEIENDLGNDPSAYINSIRKRAYGTSFPAYSNQNKYTNTLAILHEVDKEFVFEGKRWFALLRMTDSNNKSLVFDPAANYPFIKGAPAKGILPESEAYKMLWPISVSTHTNDRAIEQTPGYKE
ncbi:MAG: RagB/SusD family nutrient uptake outer membrane protein [Prevotella sp.]